MMRSVARDAELKYIDAATWAGQAISTVMTSLHMTAIAAGTGVSDRVGREITAERIDYRLNFNVGDANNTFRLILLIDDQPNGATFSQTDLFTNNADCTSMLTYEYRHRFRIIHDEFFGVDVYNPQLIKAGSVSLSSLSTKYSGTTNNISNLRSGAVYMVLISDSGAVAHPTVSGDVRLWFRDS
jgi:hypothetical protein